MNSCRPHGQRMQMEINARDVTLSDVIGGRRNPLGPSEMEKGQCDRHKTALGKPVEELALWENQVSDQREEKEYTQIFQFLLL